MALLILVAAKFALYFLLCRAAIPLLALSVEAPVPFARKFAIIRLGIRFLTGLGIFLAFGALQALGWSDVHSYLATYAPARYVEWFLLLTLIGIDFNRSALSFGARGQAWLALGTASNLAADQLVLSLNLDLKFVC